MLNVCVDKQRILTRPVCFERYHYGLSLDVLVVLSARWPQREGEKKENFRIQPLLKQVTDPVKRRIRTAVAVYGSLFFSRTNSIIKASLDIPTA